MQVLMHQYWLQTVAGANGRPPTPAAIRPTRFEPSCELKRVASSSIPGFSGSAADGGGEWPCPSCGNKEQTHPPSAELPVLPSTAGHTCVRVDPSSSPQCLYGSYLELFGLAVTGKGDKCGSSCCIHSFKAALREKEAVLTSNGPT